MPFSPRSATADTTLHFGGDETSNLEEEDRFSKWLEASDSIMSEHKDDTGWEEPPRRVLRRLRKRDG